MTDMQDMMDMGDMEDIRDMPFCWQHSIYHLPSFIRRCRKPTTLGGGYKVIVKCDKFCYTHLTIFNVLHSTVKLRLNCEYAVT